ncbi:cysteine proteinases superfamily protein [Wolffia australiana]
MGLFRQRKPSNDDVLRELSEGSAQFELVSPTPTCSLPSGGSSWSRAGFFARIGSPLSPAMNKLERYSVVKVTGDGRCMFRALAKGMARNKGERLSPHQERNDADELRMAVKEVICDSGNERLQYEEALVAITSENSLQRYCKLISRSDFWGGEAELLVLSKLCRQPVIVYIPEHEHSGGGHGYIPIAEYGIEFKKGSSKGKPRAPVRLLYSGRNHYDLLV